MSNMKFRNSDNEPIPEEIRAFCKNVPNARSDNLYLCQSVDMDGNIVDTKIGINILTNYGLNSLWVSHESIYSYYYYNIYLGNGQTEPDPTSSTLTSYISALGTGSSVWYPSYSGDVIWSPNEYDKSTHLYSATGKIRQSMWDYTTGSNQEYEIWEIGYGSAQNKLWSHALIYDTEGNQTCIVKKPNTRLYITIFWTASINVKRIQEAYERGEYALISPRIMLPTYDSDNYRYQLNIVPLVTSKLNPSLSDSSMDYSNNAGYQTSQIDPDNPQIAKGQSNNTSWTFEEAYLYTTGFLITPRRNGYPIYRQGNMFSIYNFGVFTYDELPEEGYDAVKNIEYGNVYVNSIDSALSNIGNTSIYRFDNVFGWGISTSYQNYNGRIPCLQYDVESLSLYNYISKEWDIPVPYTSDPETYYNVTHRRVYLDLYVNYQDSNRTVRVFVNPWTHLHIIAFSNSGITLVATDEYWDTDTWEQIPNLSSVPEELQQKRYYIIINNVSTVPQLNPSYDLAERPIHRINPIVEAYELTANPTCPKNNNASTINNITGSPSFKYYFHNSSPGIPISSNKYGYFLTSLHLIYEDDEKNYTFYKLMVPGVSGRPYDKYRRYVTKEEDRIIMFGSYYYRSYETQNGVDTNWTEAKNRVYITTVGDKDTTPTTETVDLVFSSNTNNNTFHRYVFSENGFLVAQRREGVDEAVILDIYGDGENPKQTLLQNCKHCYALHLSDNCVYQDTDASYDNVYVFHIYDMKNDEIIDTLTIDEGVDYTINGIFGWREFVYICVTSGGVNTMLFYNIEDKTIQHMNVDLTETHKTNGYDYGFDWCCSASEECFVSTGAGRPTRVFKSDDPTNPITLSVSGTYSSPAFKNENAFVTQIKRINDGKQLVLLLRYECDYVRVVDLGWVLDNGPIPILPSTSVCDIATGESTYHYGMACLYKNGVICVSGASDTNLRSRIFWIPIECWLRMKITGRTRHINSFNQPIKFSNKRLTTWVTNSWDLLVDDEDKGDVNG